MHVIHKDWGTQIWLSAHEMIMVMRAGATTSMHNHPHHATELIVLSGDMMVDKPDGGCERLSRNGSWPTITFVDAKKDHRITAHVDTIIHEKYMVSVPYPVEDIVRTTE